MTEAQIQLQNALTTTFLANLVFLSEYDKELYHKVDELSRMIENGSYKEKYALEFIIESGDFDIYDIINDKYLYNRNPKKINDDMVSKIQFDEKNNIYFLEEKYFSFKEKFDIDKNNRFNFNGILEFFKLTQNQMFEYSDVLNDFLEKKVKKIKKINKFIFIGTLLGRHIPRIAKKIDANTYLVLERNLEIFRLSLFTVDYTVLAEKGVIFSIMDNYKKEEKQIQDFLRNDLFSNYMIKFSTTSINIDKYVDTLNSSLNLINNSAQYTHTRYLYSLANRITKVLEKEYNILQMDKIREEFNFFNKLPILYIAPGPSLDESMEWIKKNQNKFFIVTVGAAYKKLISNNIRIDMITTLDEDILLSDIQFNNENVNKIDKNTIILASIKTHEKVLEKFSKDKLFLYEIAVPFFEKNIMFEGYSIGELTLDILLKMNAKDIYLIGLDLAINQITGTSHSKNSASDIYYFDLEKDVKKENFSITNGLIKVKGNLLEEVSTMSIFYNSIKALEEILMNNNNENVRIYNLSSHGAYFENTIPTKISDINISKLDDISIQYNDLIKLLTEYSLKKLDDKSMKNLELDVETLKITLENFVQNFQNNKFYTYSEFHDSIVDFFLSLKVNNKLIIVVLKKYLMMLLPYLSFHFNNAKIKREDKELEKIREIFIIQIETIFEDYINCLKRIVK